MIEHNYDGLNGADEAELEQINTTVKKSGIQHGEYAPLEGTTIIGPAWSDNKYSGSPLIQPRIRGFEPVVTKHRQTTGSVLMPKRGTVHSAGYDFFLVEDVIIPARTKMVIWSDVKAYMCTDEQLLIYPRSSTGNKYGIRLRNTVGVVDSDYYSCDENDGNIGFFIENELDFAHSFTAGSRLFQGVFEKYLKIDGDTVTDFRFGGWGHTGT